MVGAIRNSTATAIVASALYVLILLWEMNLRDPRYLDGWLLVGLMLMQLTYHMRRGWIGRSLTSAARWLKLHIYVGYLVVALFIIHTQFRLPDSMFEWALWILFVVTAVSGVVSAYLSSAVPSKLDLGGRDIEFDAVPAERAKLASEVAGLAERAATDASLRPIAEFYVSNLHSFFERPRYVLQHMRHSPRPLRNLTERLNTLERYLDDAGREHLQVIRQLIVRKFYLDFQYAQHLLLQWWLFVHVPATYGLIVAVVVHVAQSYAFTAGVP